MCLPFPREHLVGLADNDMGILSVDQSFDVQKLIMLGNLSNLDQRATVEECPPGGASGINR